MTRFNVVTDRPSCPPTDPLRTQSARDSHPPARGARARPGALRLEGEEALWQGVGLAWGGAVEGSGLASKKLAALHHAVAGHPDVGHPGETVACKGEDGGLYCGREVDGCPLRISRTEAGRVCESQGLSAPPTLPPAIDAYLLS